MEKITKFENFNQEQDKFFIVGYGLGGGFGGIHNYEVTKQDSENDASIYAWERACEEYESHEGSSGLRSIDEIIDEEGVHEDEAEEIYNEERESWLDYKVLKFNKENLKKVSGYHFHNPYSDQTDKFI